MTRRQTMFPRRWLMTDERLREALLPLIARLPRGTGVVVRHHSLGRPGRSRLACEIAAIARMRGLVLSVATDERLARRAGAAFVHNPSGRRSSLARSFAVHDLTELRRARLAGAEALFVSPLFPTRSHGAAAPLGRWRAAALVRHAGSVPVYALGGMSDARFRRIKPLGFAGWAAIDAWTGVRT